MTTATARRRLLSPLDRLAPAVAHLQRLRGRGVIVLHHRIGPDDDPAHPRLPVDEFERHLDLITATYAVVPLEELVRRVRVGDSVAGLCALTFDDGYRDFLDHAYPVLSRRQLPSTHFLVGECLETGRPHWNYRLNRLLPRLDQGRTKVEWKAWVGELSRADRAEWLDAAEDRLSVTADDPPLLRSDDLAAVDGRLVSWGSHGQTHASLAATSAADAEEELVQSRTSVGAAAGHPPTMFSYPNGSVSATAARLAADAGYDAAFAVGQRPLRADADPYTLPRVDVSCHPATMLRLETTGVLASARRALRRSLR